MRRWLKFLTVKPLLALWGGFASTAITVLLAHLSQHGGVLALFAVYAGIVAIVCFIACGLMFSERKHRRSFVAAFYSALRYRLYARAVNADTITVFERGAGHPRRELGSFAKDAEDSIIECMSRQRVARREEHSDMTEARRLARTLTRNA